MFRSLPLIWLVLFTSFESLAFAKDPVAGTPVVVIKNGATLAVNGKSVGTVEELQHFVVDDIEGKWIWIKSKGAYLLRADVVPLNDAIAYYTRQLNSAKTADNYYKRARVWFLKQELDIAIGDLNDAIRLKPSEGSYLATRGVILQEKGEYDKAIADFSEAIRFDPNSHLMYRLRADAKFRKDEFEKALADYQEAIRLEPNDQSALEGRRAVWKSLKVWDKLIIDYDSAIKQNPKNAKLFNLRGQVWQELGDDKKALADYEEAIRLDPEHEAALTNRRRLKPLSSEELRQIVRKAVSEAAEQSSLSGLNREIKKNPKNAELYYRRGLAWALERNKVEALADFEEAIRLDPQLEDAQAARLMVWYELGEWEKATQYLEATAKGAKNDQQRERACIQFAWLRMTCPDEKYRNIPQAVEYATKGCEMTKWQNASALYALAGACAESGDFEKAIEWQKKGMETDKTANPDDVAEHESQLKLYRERKPPSKWTEQAR